MKNIKLKITGIKDNISKEKLVNKLKDKDVKLESSKYNAEIEFGEKVLKTAIMGYKKFMKENAK